MISVIIPLYNKEKSIANTLRAVLNQTFQEFEIVVVNDGSADNSVAEVSKVQDSRIRIVNQENTGVSSARNRGIEEAKYDLIAFLDADDEWKPEYLETQYNLYKKFSDCSVFVCDYEFHDTFGRVMPTIIKKIPFDTEDGILTNYFEVASFSHPPLWTSAVMVKKQAIQNIGGFPLGITNGEDLLTWAELAVKFKIAYSKKVKSVYVLKAGFGTNSKPVNIPQGNDVGIGLEKLLNDYKEDIISLRHYIGRWYKIRAHLFLRGGEKRNALVNIFRTIKFHPKEWKIYLYLCMIPLPTSFINYIFKHI